MTRRFGELLGEGISSVARRRRQTIAMVEQEIGEAVGRTHHTVQRWKRGHTPATEEQTAFVVRYCVQNGRLSRQWARSILRQAKYPDRAALLNELFPAAPAARETAPTIYQNLPPRYGEFLGREAKIEELRDALTTLRYPLISIEGMGGVGKTTLAVETARRLMGGEGKKSFTAVVWVSAKDRPQQKQWLNEVLDTTARVLDYPYITQLELPQKKQEINNLLRAHPVLLIIDNFETIEDEALVQWLAYLPEPSKGLLTTRHAQMRRLWPVHLGGLPEAEALELIRRHARRLGLRRLSAAADDAFRPLADVTEGNPKAIEMALGYVKRGMLDLPEIVDHLHEARETVNDVFAYLFANAWTLLNDDARQLLQAVSFFVSPIAKGALAQTADLSGYRLAQAIGQLTDLSLLDIQPELEGVYYEAHPLVRAFARKKLETQPAWEAAARRRWLEWYQALVDEHGGEDWEEMQEDYDHLEREWKNILAVLEWCAANGQYTRVKNLWTDRKIYEFANIYGYWTDLLIWSDWIAGKAKEEQDWSLVATALSERNWPLLLQGNPSQLENVLHSLEYAWNFREHIDVYTLSRLVNRFVLLFLQKGDLAKAKTWLSTHRSLIERIDNVNFRKDRRLITLLYYQAEIHYIEEELKKAEDVYKQVIEIGKRSHWQRAVTYSQNQLANVALAQDQLEEAENLLTQGLPIATRNKDKRRIAFYKRSYALLEQKRGNWETAVRWAREALDGFTRLGMQIEIEEMAQLVEALEERTVI